MMKFLLGVVAGFTGACLLAFFKGEAIAEFIEEKADLK